MEKEGGQVLEKYQQNPDLFDLSEYISDLKLVKKKLMVKYEDAKMNEAAEDITNDFEVLAHQIEQLREAIKAFEGAQSEPDFIKNGKTALKTLCGTTFKHLLVKMEQNN